MKQSITVLTICIAVSFFQGSLAGDIILGEEKSISARYNLSPVAELDVSIRKISDNTPVFFINPQGGMTFSGINLSSFGINRPWVVADQYLRVSYNCNYPSWGIRIVTDNVEDIGPIYPKLLDKGEDGEWEWEKQGLERYGYVDGRWDIGDDIVSYGGLININDMDNSTLRAELGWQVRGEWLSLRNFGFKPPITNDTPDFDYGTPGNDPEAIRDDWKSNWAYVVDKGDTGYKDEVITGFEVEEDTEGHLIIKAVYNYNVAIFGGGTKHFLSQHPKNTESDINGEPIPRNDLDRVAAVYISARFCSKDYTVDTDNDEGTPFILPRGDYRTTLCVEMIFE